MILEITHQRLDEGPIEVNIEAAIKVAADHRPGIGPVTDRKRVKAIIAAALEEFIE